VSRSAAFLRRYDVVRSALVTADLPNALTRRWGTLDPKRLQSSCQSTSAGF
jgi:hypothetical protein